MRADERRALWRTSFIAAAAAVAASAGVFWVTHLPVAALDQETVFARALHDAVAASLLAKDLKSTEAKALAAGAEAHLRSASQGNGFDEARVRDADPEAINHELSAHEKTRRFRLLMADTKISVGRTQSIAGHDVFIPADGPMRHAHDDDWLFSTGVVPLRALQERLLGEGLLALIDRPALCPSAFRVEDARSLGAVLDRRYATAARAALGDDAASDGEALLPLCRRERLRRLADVAMRQSKAAIPFPFVAGLRLDAASRATLEKLEDPSQTAHLGADARAHCNGMTYSEDELDRQQPALAGAVRALLPRFFSDAALLADAYRATTTLPPPSAAVLALTEKKDLNETTRVLCVLQSVAHASAAPASYLSSLIDRFTLEQWPPPPERSAMLALLYGARPLPKEGVASWAALSAIAQTLPTTPPDACTALHPPEISSEDLDALVALMLN